MDERIISYVIEWSLSLFGRRFAASAEGDCSTEPTIATCVRRADLTSCLCTWPTALCSAWLISGSS
jgi:hypothetical protein